MNMVDRSGMLARWMYIFIEGRECVNEWKMMKVMNEGAEKVF